MDIKELKPGMRVVFVDERLNVGGPADVFGAPESATDLAGLEMMVLAVRPDDNTGKMVACATKVKREFGHTCDGLAPAGHGVWVRPEHLYTPSAHKAHAQACAEWAEQQKESQALVEEFLKG